MVCSCIAAGLFSYRFIHSINKPTEKNLWHTVYVGIAAYENPYVKELSDNEGYRLYEETTGERLSASHRW